MAALIKKSESRVKHAEVVPLVQRVVFPDFPHEFASGTIRAVGCKHELLTDNIVIGADSEFRMFLQDKIKKEVTRGFAFAKNGPSRVKYNRLVFFLCQRKSGIEVSDVRKLRQGRQSHPERDDCSEYNPRPTEAIVANHL